MTTDDTAPLTIEPVLLDGLDDPAPITRRTTTEQAVTADVDRLLARTRIQQVWRSADWVSVDASTARWVERVTAVPPERVSAMSAFEQMQLAALTLDWPIEGNELDPPRLVAVSADRTTRVEVVVDGAELSLVAQSAPTPVGQAA